MQPSIKEEELRYEEIVRSKIRCLPKTGNIPSERFVREIDYFGITDIEKLRPMLYAPECRAYRGVGSFLGRHSQSGKGFKHVYRGIRKVLACILLG